MAAKYLNEKSGARDIKPQNLPVIKLQLLLP
jgi:hypothetical protein